MKIIIQKNYNRSHDPMRGLVFGAWGGAPRKSTASSAMTWAMIGWAMIGNSRQEGRRGVRRPPPSCAQTLQGRGYHRLIGMLAHVGSRRHWPSMQARSADEAQEALAWMLRRRWAPTASRPSLGERPSEVGAPRVRRQRGAAAASRRLPTAAGNEARARRAACVFRRGPRAVLRHQGHTRTMCVFRRHSCLSEVLQGDPVIHTLYHELMNGILMCTGNSPEILSQQILVGIILAGRFGAARARCPLLSEPAP